MIIILMHTLDKRRQTNPTGSLFSCFRETDHFNCKVSFIGSIITQQYANQIHNLKKNLKINQLSMRITYQQFQKQLLLEMNHFTVSRNTYGPQLKRPPRRWDSLVLYLKRNDI